MLVEIYRLWKIYYSAIPKPLWTATDRIGLDKDIYSYEGLEAIKDYIDEEMRRKSDDAFTTGSE